MVREVLDAQRRRVVELRDEGAISDDVLHALERELDLEDQRLEIELSWRPWIARSA